MGNAIPFEESNGFLLLAYKITFPICFLLNILAIYLIVFKSTREMKNYRWHLLNYQIWAASIDIFFNVLYQPVIFLPVVAMAGRGVLITNLGFSTFTCIVMYFVQSPVCSSSFNSGIVFLPSPVHCQQTD
uniref:Serpentine receptor class gamma n=1 Tax=Heterorhabditis bacteriophora TaxID=37862 RepID=A0A1I7W7Z2_HETBA